MMDKCVIIDDFLSPEKINFIDNTIMSTKFPWYYKNTTTDIYSLKADIQQYEFPFLSHTLIYDYKDNSELCYIAHDIVNEFNKKHIIFKKYDICRAMVNITFPSNIINSPPHVDQKFPHKVLIYYTHDCDGDTILYDDLGLEYRITPKRGRAVLFNGNVIHSGCSPILSKKRTIININIEEII